MTDTVALVEEAMRQKRGEPSSTAAFTALVKRFQDMVFGYAFSILHDAHLSEDVVQDVFLTAWRKLDTLRVPRAFVPWLRRIAERRCREVFRRPRDPGLTETEIEALASPYTAPGEVFEAGETRSEIRRSVDGLPEDQRTPLILHYIDGYSQAEIAEFLGLEPSSVRKRLQRGRDRMRNEYMNRVKDDLASVRPSRDTMLVDRVTFLMNMETAARMGELAVLEQMLVDGADPAQPDASGRTLLHWAVESGNVDAVKLLQRSGADGDMPDARGITPRMLAKRKRNPEIMPLFEGTDR